VTKLNPSGSAAVYSTLLGGGGDDQARGIALDSSGNAYATGVTDSPDFPVTSGAFQPSFGGGSVPLSSPSSSGDAFVTKLNPAGSALLYSSYLGGLGDDAGNGIAVDGAGNAYVTGLAGSLNFPTTPGSFHPAVRAGSHAFVAKLPTAGPASAAYSTLLAASSSFTSGQGVAVDASGNAYVTGFTFDTSFPTTAGAFQTTLVGTGDVYVTKLNPSGSALVYSTFLGSTNKDFGFGIAVDHTGTTYVTGQTNNGVLKFPTTPDAFTGTVGRAFVTAINPAGSALVYSTGLPAAADFGFGIAVDGAGNAYVTGSTSGDFPTTSGSVRVSGPSGFGSFVAKLAPEPIQVLTQSLTTIINGLNLNAQLSAALLGFVQQIPTAISSLTTAQRAAAVANLNTFTATIQSLIAANIIPAAQGSQLVTIANQVIAALSR
jgi:hypothetical protein